MDKKILMAGVIALAEHMKGNSTQKVSEYASIKKLWQHLKVSPYRKLVYRGFAGKKEDLEKVLSNKTFKYSSTAEKSAESWSTEATVAFDFATKFRQRVQYVFIARPRKMDVIFSMTKTAAKKVKFLANRFGLGECVRTMDKYIWEKEVLLPTGNRKYTLCKNIVYIRMGTEHLSEEVLGLIESRISKKGYQKLLSMKILATNVEFACAKGKLVLLADGQAWAKKLDGN